MPSSPTRSPEKPMAGRFFALVVAWLLPLSAGAQALTEHDAVTRALERAPLAESLEGASRAAIGRASAAGAYPNPQLTYLREQTFGDNGTGEDYLSIAQVIDLGNRRGLRRDAGERRAEARVRAADATRAEVAAEARERFFEVLYRQARVTAIADWITRIEGALAIVAAREARGDAATYDRRRLERERAVAQGRVATERAQVMRARARLAAYIDEDVEQVDGALLPDRDPPALDRLRALVEQRPDLEALRLQAEAASIEGNAADRWWAPDLRLEAGFKGVDLGALGRTDGFLASATLTVPLWDQSSGLAEEAIGLGLAANGERALLASEIAGELEASHASAVALRAAAIELRTATTAASADLVRIAAAGYEGGELGLLELLDAYRGSAEDALHVLDLEHEARHARIEVDRHVGRVTP